MQPSTWVISKVIVDVEKIVGVDRIDARRRRSRFARCLNVELVGADQECVGMQLAEFAGTINARG